MNKGQEVEQWIELYSSELLSRALYLLSDLEEAKDMVQDVFLSAYSGYQSFKGDSSPKTWLYTILKNKVADYYRRKYKSPSKLSLDSYFDDAGNWKSVDHLLEAWEETSSASDETISEGILENCIERLPPKWKIPVKLYYLEEKKTAEVCQDVGLTTTNLWKILQRARLQLRECLETKEFSHD